MARVIHFLLIIAFATAIISPACAFVSGKGLRQIEICTAEGVQLIQVDAQGNKTTAPAHQTSKTDCAFCFTHSHAKAFIPDAGVILVKALNHYDSIEIPSAQLQSVITQSYIARAPPSFLF